jgi:hypothetical protein
VPFLGEQDEASLFLQAFNRRNEINNCLSMVGRLTPMVATEKFALVLRAGRHTIEERNGALVGRRYTAT